MFTRTALALGFALPTIFCSVAAACPQPMTENPSRYLDAASGQYRFKSPSGTLGCTVSFPDAQEPARGRFALCAVNDTRPYPGYESNCEADDATGAAVEAEGARYSCSGEAFRGAAPILEYGHAIRVGDFTCNSQTTGLSCFYTIPGFTVSREKITLY